MKLNTIPNWITLIRFVLYLVVLVLVLFGSVGAKQIALPLYVLVFAMDKLDGYVARKYNQVSEVGKFFDLSADRAIVTGLLVCYVYFFPNVWVLLILIYNLIRDFLVAGLRQLAAINGVFMKAHIMGKIKFITENLSVVMMVYMMSFQVNDMNRMIISNIILVILIIGLISGSYSLGLYMKQVLTIKEK